MSFKSLFVRLDKNKNEKQKSSVIVAKPKVNIHGKIQSLFLIISDFFCSYSFPGLQPFILVHPGLALIFICRLSPQPLRPTTEISRLLWFSVVANSKLCRGRSRNSSVVESQSDFVSERPFFQFHEQQAQFANEVHRLTHFFEKGDS